MKSLLILTLSFLSITALSAEVSIYKNVKIQTCSRVAMGCAPKIILENGSSLLLDTSYARDILSEDKDSKGIEIEAREVMGVITLERGHFPNPMADFEVFKAIRIIK